MAVYRVEGALQQIARFAVDPANGVLQRFHRLGQVGRLHVEVALALGGCFQFLQGSHVDGAQLGNGVIQAGNFTL